ncbi:MAG: phage shock protein operon transcriptional activator [Opitutales bacterium]|nr:phage shock protein operon transcriptional activator [Opitutales bacterium]NRA27306.1 phage shock protein operon transcriptional activator [Opitutales bacterium]
MSLNQERLPEAIGESDAFLAFQDQLSTVAPVERPVLLIGERGTGKELAASRVHFLSQRWDGPMITLNCASLPETILESELFGHEAGAFTGATKRRKGRFEEAHGGTLFLDEIGQVPMAVQEKILRVVEYGTFERVGSNQAITVDVRIIGATNADLPALVKADKFKADLLDRLSFEVLFLPPLRERGEDILVLAQHFAGRMADELGRDPWVRISPRAEKQLLTHPWPGNIRELKNTIERAVVHSTGEEITQIQTNPFANPWAAPPPTSDRSDSKTAILKDPTSFHWSLSDGDLKTHVDGLERHAIETALKAHRHKPTAAAEALGLNYHQLRNLIRKHNLKA